MNFLCKTCRQDYSLGYCEDRLAELQSLHEGHETLVRDSRNDYIKKGELWAKRSSGPDDFLDPLIPDYDSYQLIDVEAQSRASREPYSWA